MVTINPLKSAQFSLIALLALFIISAGLLTWQLWSVFKKKKDKKPYSYTLTCVFAGIAAAFLIGTVIAFIIVRRKQ